MKSVYFKKNIKELKKANPDLAFKVLEAQKEKKFHLIRGKDPLDMDILDIHREASIYISPVDETEDSIRKIEGENPLHPILFFFGIGNALLHKVLLSNPKHKHIYVFESEIGIIANALECVDLEEEIKSRKLVIINANTFNYAMAYSIFMDKTYKIYAKLYSLTPTTEYYIRHCYKQMSVINGFMTRAIKQMVYSHGNDANDSLMGIEHHLNNLNEMLDNPKFLGLINKKNTKTAIVVSTGPSLDKQLPLLKKMQDYICIISPDASVPHLESHGIHADIIVSLERTEIVASILKGASKEYQKDKIYLLASVLHKNAINSVYGEKCIVMRPFGYTFYFDKLRHWGYHGIGMSVANMAHELAFIMKFKKVALIGQDLSYGKGGESHSVGNVYGDKQRKIEDDNLKEITAYGGSGVVKSYDGWILFKNYFESAIEDTKDKMKTYNCTEGGARIEGSIETSFEDFCEFYVDKEMPKKRIILEKPSIEESADAKEYASQMIDEWLDYGKKVRINIEELYKEVSKYFDLIKKADEQKDDSIINYKDLENVSDKIDDIKGYFKDEKFSKLFFDVVQSFIVQQEMDLASIVVFAPKDDEGRKHKIKSWVVNHKYWLFSLSAGIKAVLDIVKKYKQ